MSRITPPERFEQVEHILGSGTGVLDFAIAGESEYQTREDQEDTE